VYSDEVDIRFWRKPAVHSDHFGEAAVTLPLQAAVVLEQRLGVRQGRPGFSL